MTKIIVNEFYNHPGLYRFMPRNIFDALEKAYLQGHETVSVSESDYLQMTHKMILKNGIEDN